VQAMKQALVCLRLFLCWLVPQSCGVSPLPSRLTLLLRCKTCTLHTPAWIYGEGRESSCLSRCVLDKQDVKRTARDTGPFDTPPFMCSST